MIIQQKLRVERLRELMGDLSIAAFCRKFDDVDPTYISQILNGHRNFGEKAARNMELKLGLSAGWLDRSDSTNSETPWPFKSITYDEYARLDAFDKREIESALALKAEKVRQHNKSMP